ncbi:MAG: divalent-cation tolerance protein CutA [Acidiferrobacterales bacterium]
MAETPYQIVLTALPDASSAQQLGEALVHERLAACVSILPAMQSIYTWQGKTETATEHLVLIKSLVSRYAAIQDRIQALHPYELPEILAVPIADGLPAYLAWLHNLEFNK